MLTSRTKRGSLLAVVLMTVGLLSGAVAVQAQDGVTLTPGTGASPQEELLAEALGAVVQAGFDPADFDFDQAVFDPRGRAVFLPVRATDELRRQARAFVQDEQRFLLAGLLYARQSFEFQGKRYGRGVHPIVLENPLVPVQEDSSDRSLEAVPALYQNGSCVNNCINIQCNDCIVIIGDQTVINPNPPPTGPQPGQVCVGLGFGSLVEGTVSFCF